MKTFSVALTAVAVLPLAAMAQRGTAIKDNPDAHKRWYYEQRAYPFDDIPPAAMENARQQLRMLTGGSLTGNAPPILPGATGGWTSLGPSAIDASLSTFYNGTALTSGRVDAIAVHPTDSNIIYAGTYGGGIWKTTNAGVTWLPVSDNQCSLYIGALAIDPVNPNIIYAGTADPLNGVNTLKACGLLRSTDAGATWTQYGTNQMVSNLGNQLAVGTIVVDKATAGSTSSTIVLATSVRGLYRSTNSGQTWTQVSGKNGWYTDLVADPSTPGTLYMTSRDFGASGGIWKSTNSGATWTALAGGLPTTNYGYGRLAITRTAATQTIYALLAGSSTEFLGLYKSTNAGATWTKTALTSSFCTPQCNYGLTVATDPDNGGSVYVGGLWIWKSSDGGATFANTSQSAHVDQHALVNDPTDPAILYQGSDGGLYRSTDRGATWTGLNAGMVTALFVKGLATTGPNGVKILGGLQDNGSVEFLGQDQWKMVTTGDGGASAYSKAGTTAWSQYIWAPPGASQFSGPQRRDPAPGSGGFVYKRTGIDLNDRGQFYPPLIMDPVDDQTLYFGTYRLYRTSNNGELWSPVSADLSKATGSITVIDIAPSDPNVIYVGTSDGNIKVSGDKGATWTTSTGQPNRLVTDFAIDNANPLIAYATFSGFGSGHVYKTINRGVTWANISGTQLPDAPANAVVILPGTTEIEVGTDQGILRTTNDGANWSVFPGLPNVEIMDLIYDFARNMLYAATYGRGVFSYAVPSNLALRGDVTGDSQVTAVDGQAALNAAVGNALPTGYKPAPNGDANCDGQVTALDAQIILSFAVGQNTTQFCVGFYR